ncbi:MAG: hypothetical protein ACR2KJ_11185 [Jatrophihabitans sp.]
MPSTDIARRSDFPLDAASQLQLAKALADAGVLPAHLRKAPANILAIGMAARALDIPTWTALQQVVPIDGKVSIQADLMRALILRAGHRFRVESAEPESATVALVRADDSEYTHRVTVTLAEIPADLRKRRAWQDYPADMLVARATAKVARRACSDVLNGMSYTPDELGADTDPDGQGLPDDREQDTTRQDAQPVPPRSDNPAQTIVDAEIVPDSDNADETLPATTVELDSVIAEADRAGFTRTQLDRHISDTYDGRTLASLTRAELRAEWRRLHQDTATAEDVTR